ncbi:hypothetical protein [Methanobacterium sp. ACI-7]|uniref:hypothetical protein n=1 Tax=unclassified Methanobacterium TaxID=2627676 RepID=UPI0039C18A9B
MKKNNFVNKIVKDNFDLVGMYFLEHNLLKSNYVDEEELLNYIHSIIEAITIKNCVEDENEEYQKYLKLKKQDIMWLAAKTRFRAQNDIFTSF